MRVRAFRGLLPPPELAAEVASVPYDVVDAAEARALAQGNPHSFLRIIRAEIEFPEGADPYADEAYARAAENLQRFRDEGLLRRDATPCLYVYRQKMSEHVQSGVVACCHIDDIRDGKIKKHERTHRNKEDDRTRHVKTLMANAGPVFFTYRGDAKIDALIEAIETNPPHICFTAPDGVEHALWRVNEVEPLRSAFARIPAFYVADGHHRTAAAARAGAELREANPNHTGEEEYNWFLTVLFPAAQLSVLPYNRSVRGLGMAPEEFLAEVRARFVTKENAEPSPSEPRRVSMYLAGKWYGLSWETPDADDPVAALDVSVLQDRLFGPVLGIADPRSDERIEFVGGARGTEELERRVDGGAAEVAFSMYPVTLNQVMEVADAGRIMPPKSTWFEPKLRSGLVTHTLDE